MRPIILVSGIEILYHKLNTSLCVNKLLSFDNVMRIYCKMPKWPIPADR